MGFKQLLQEKLSTQGKIPLELIPLAPRGFQELNKRVILNLNADLEPYAKEIATAILELFPRMKGFWLRKGQIEGKFRQPQGLVHILGDTETELIITENGVRYKFDFTKIMFAKGNIHERNLLPKKIQPNEVIIDMFAGIGYFTLGIAKTKKPARVYSIEWNPESFSYLQQNIKLNHVESIVNPILGDCKEQVPILVNQGILADRIIMGLIPAPVDAIPVALGAIKPSGSIIVYEGVEPKESTALFDEFQTIASGLNISTSIVERRIVKAFKPHEYHVVIEILAQPN